MTDIPNEYRRQRLAIIAQSLSVASLFSALFMTIIFPYILGGISIIMAVISKGKAQTTTIQAKLAILLSTVTIIGYSVVLGATFYNIFFNAEFRETLNQVYEEMYGVTYDEYIEETFGGSVTLPEPR